MRYCATVLHNSGPGMFRRLSAGDNLSEAATFEVHARGPAAACEQAWVLCNVDRIEQLPPSLARDPDCMEVVRTYRRRRNRSLSVADVVVLADPGAQISIWEVVPVGFEEVRTGGLRWTADDASTPVSAAYTARMRRSRHDCLHRSAT